MICSSISPWCYEVLREQLLHEKVYCRLPQPPPAAERAASTWLPVSTTVRLTVTVVDSKRVNMRCESAVRCPSRALTRSLYSFSLDPVASACCERQTTAHWQRLGRGGITSRRHNAAKVSVMVCRESRGKYWPPVVEATAW